MKIGIDARVLDRKMTGTGRYLKNLLEGIPSFDNKNEYYVFINDDSQIDIKFYNQVKVKKNWFPSKIYSYYWLNFVLPKEAKRLRLDVFFTCNILLPFIKLKNTKKITVVHDVIYKAEKSYYPFLYRNYLNTLLPFTFNIADKVLTASEYSRNEILKYFNVSPKNISVLYTSADTKFTKMNLREDEKSIIRNKYNLPEKFLLFVGTIEKRKNIETLFQLAEILSNKGINLPIVLVGKSGFGYKNISRRIERMKERIIYIDYVSENDIQFIYNLSFIFIFPSLFEGFGIPPLEAMQCKIPVISSNASCLPEILGEGAIFVEPNDVDGYIDEIVKLISDEDYYEMFQEKGFEHSKKYSIIKSAQTLVETFNNMKRYL